MEKDIAIRRNIKGIGVYALRPFKKGEKIVKFTGRKYSDVFHYRRGTITDPLQVGPKSYIDLYHPGIDFNHSCDPNAGLKGVMTLFAIKNIKRNEEITFDYSTTMDESFICHCGAKSCRGIMMDFFGLPKKVQQYYFKLGALQDFIIKKMVRINNGKCPCGSGKKYKRCHGK
jgi:hypothetical protein